MTTENQTNQQIRAQVIAATWMKKELDAFIKDHSPAFRKELGEGDTVAARYDLDGQEIPLGKISKTEPKLGWKLRDPEALLEWAQENQPALTRTVVELDKDAVDDLLKQVTAQNAAITEDGEIIPGIEWTTTSNPYIRFTPAKGFADTLALLQREGRLGELTAGLLSLEAPDA